MIRPALRRGLAKKAVARRGVSIALACRTFDVSETCYRYSPFLSDDNEEIVDLLVGPDRGPEDLGVWVMFSAPTQRAGPSVEPQTRLPDLLRT